MTPEGKIKMDKQQRRGLIEERGVKQLDRREVKIDSSGKTGW